MKAEGKRGVERQVNGVGGGASYNVGGMGVEGELAGVVFPQLIK